MWSIHLIYPFYQLIPRNHFYLFWTWTSIHQYPFISAKYYTTVYFSLVSIFQDCNIFFYNGKIIFNWYPFLTTRTRAQLNELNVQFSSWKIFQTFITDRYRIINYISNQSYRFYRFLSQITFILSLNPLFYKLKLSR